MHTCHASSLLDPNSHHPWFGIRTRSNQERTAFNALSGRGYCPFLPTYIRTRPKSADQVSLPLFPGYVFCRLDVQERLPVLTAPGVVSILSFARTPAPIPDKEILAFQTVLTADLAAKPVPYLFTGQRVRVTDGYLRGLEGVLLQLKSSSRFVVSLTLLQRSISVEIDSNLLLPL